MVNNVQETRAVGAAWGSDDRIGVTVEADEDNATANAVDTYINIQYRNETGGSFRVVNEGSTDNNIRLKGEGEFTLNAYYPYRGANGTLPGTEGGLQNNQRSRPDNRQTAANRLSICPGYRSSCRVSCYLRLHIK